jgi:hypothetical protein
LISVFLNQNYLGRPQINGKIMINLITTLTKYLNKFLELGVLLLAISVIAEIVFGPNVAFFGSQVTANLINLLNALGEQGIAALIIVLAVIFAYRKILK